MRYLLFESAAGIAIFSIKEFDDVAKFTAELQRSIADGGAFSTLVKLSSFHRFSGNEDAAAVCAALQEGVVPETVLRVVQGIMKGSLRPSEWWMSASSCLWTLQVCLRSTAASWWKFPAASSATFEANGRGCQPRAV